MKNKHLAPARLVVEQLVASATAWGRAMRDYPEDGPAQVAVMDELERAIGLDTLSDRDFALQLCGRVLASVMLEVERRDEVVGGAVMPGGAYSMLQGFILACHESWRAQDEEEAP